MSDRMNAFVYKKCYPHHSTRRQKTIIQ